MLHQVCMWTIFILRSYDMNILFSGNESVIRQKHSLHFVCLCCNVGHISESLSLPACLLFSTILYCFTCQSSPGGTNEFFLQQEQSLQSACMFCLWAFTWRSQYLLCTDQSAIWHSREQYCEILHLPQTMSNRRSFDTPQWKQFPNFGRVFLASKCIFFKHLQSIFCGKTLARHV